MVDCAKHSVVRSKWFIAGMLEVVVLPLLHQWSIKKRWIKPVSVPPIFVRASIGESAISTMLISCKKGEQVCINVTKELVKMNTRVNNSFDLLNATTLDTSVRSDTRRFECYSVFACYS